MPRMSAGGRWWPWAGAALLALAARPASAEPSENDGRGVAGEVHGFGSQGFVLTTGNDYLVPDTKRGSFQLSEVGLNYSRDLADKLRFGVQLFAQNFGAAGNYTPQVDWLSIDYHWRDWLGLRVGRLKIPVGLFNEVNDIDSARVPILLPQSVYPLQARSFLFAQTGGELYGFARSRVAGAIEYRLYGGTIFIDPKLVIPVGSPIQLKFNVPFAFGARVLWETPVPGLRIGASVLDLRLDTIAFLPMSMTVGIEGHTLVGLGSLEYVWRALTIDAEYSRGRTKQESVVASSNFTHTSESAYVMASYAITPWLWPGAYYALTFPDVEHREGAANHQHDATLTLRFDINQHWIFKLEGHYMAGTSGLVNPLTIGPPPAAPKQRWGVFLAKTTAYF
jgi:hypothetical protein